MLPRSVPMKACSILFARRHKLRVPVSKTILDADRLGGPELRPRTSPSRVGPEVTPPSRARATGCRSPSHADRAFGERGQSMRILLIYCHPRPDSYCAALREVATEALKSAGHVVEVRDLYAEGFYPVLDAEERGRYYDEGDHRPDISSHVASLLRAEALVFVYPTWWFSPPATLKGWFDRVLAAGRRLPRRRSSGAAATAGGRPAHRRGHDLRLPTLVSLARRLARLATVQVRHSQPVRSSLSARLDRAHRHGQLHSQEAGVVHGQGPGRLRSLGVTNYRSRRRRNCNFIGLHLFGKGGPSRRASVGRPACVNADARLLPPRPCPGKRIGSAERR